MTSGGLKPYPGIMSWAEPPPGTVRWAKPSPLRVTSCMALLLRSLYVLALCLRSCPPVESHVDDLSAAHRYSSCMLVLPFYHSFNLDPCSASDTTVEAPLRGTYLAFTAEVCSLLFCTLGLWHSRTVRCRTRLST